MRRTTTALALIAGLAACAAEPDLAGRVAPDADAREIRRAADGRCFGRVVRPARIETVTVQEQVSPAVLAADGRVLTRASYRSASRQRIVSPRREEEFEALCPEGLGPDLVASLQRALSARGIYAGPAAGLADAATVDALRRYQASRGGPDSGVLSRRAAVDLGLIAARPEEVEELL